MGSFTLKFKSDQGQKPLSINFNSELNLLSKITCVLVEIFLRGRQWNGFKTMCYCFYCSFYRFWKILGGQQRFRGRKKSFSGGRPLPKQKDRLKVRNNLLLVSDDKRYGIITRTRTKWSHAEISNFVKVKIKIS